MKPDNVKFVQISSLVKAEVANIQHVIVFGLGDDEKVYKWTGTGWKLYG